MPSTLTRRRSSARPRIEGRLERPPAALRLTPGTPRRRAALSSVSVAGLAVLPRSTSVDAGEAEADSAVTTVGSSNSTPEAAGCSSTAVSAASRGPASSMPSSAAWAACQRRVDFDRAKDEQDVAAILDMKAFHTNNTGQHTAGGRMRFDQAVIGCGGARDGGSSCAQRRAASTAAEPLGAGAANRTGKPGGGIGTAAKCAANWQ